MFFYRIIKMNYGWFIGKYGLGLLKIYDFFILRWDGYII